MEERKVSAPKQVIVVTDQEGQIDLRAVGTTTVTHQLEKALVEEAIMEIQTSIVVQRGLEVLTDLVVPTALEVVAELRVVVDTVEGEQWGKG